MSSHTLQKDQANKNRVWIITLTALFGVMAVLLFYIIICIWPSGYVSSKDPFKLFGTIYTITAEHRFLLLMILGGALGANIHLIISFTAFVGNRTFVTTWIPWYLLRPVIGAGMAMFFYMLLRGGILTYSPPVAPELPESTPLAESTITPSDSPATAVTEGGAITENTGGVTQDTGAARQDTVAKDPCAGIADSSEAVPAVTKDEATQERDSVPLNPYGMMAIACLVGLFSKEASEKLEEVFKTLFNVKDKTAYKDPLPSNKTNTDDTPPSDDNAADAGMGDQKTEPM